jgi:pimeloyl-ACP methyl ester carboxylesterase
MRKGFLILIITLNLYFYYPQALLWAQEYSVSIIETGKTAGFDSPTLHLNIFSALIHFFPQLFHNRSLQEPFIINEDEKRGAIGAPIDFCFMAAMILNKINAFNQLIDPYDNPQNPASGYTWDIKIFHPGDTPGQLPAEGAPYPIIIFCPGAGGNDPRIYDALDWMGTYYAQRGYIFAIPAFIENVLEIDGIPNEGLESISEICADIYALQVSQTIDYLSFIRLGLLNSWRWDLVDNTQVTLIGHSQGGYVAQRVAAQDFRVSRLCLLSSIFIYYDQLYAGILDTKDTYDLLNGLPKQRGMALHVQRFTKPPYPLPCPEWDPECDWIPPVDGYLTQVDLTSDPWEPYLCGGESCGVRDGTYYNYLLYEGPKQSEIKNNSLLDHSGIVIEDTENEEGKQLTLQLLDEFFAEFPLH